MAQQSSAHDLSFSSLGGFPVIQKENNAESNEIMIPCPVCVVVGGASCEGPFAGHLTLYSSADAGPSQWLIDWVCQCFSDILLLQAETLLSLTLFRGKVCVCVCVCAAYIHMLYLIFYHILLCPDLGGRILENSLATEQIVFPTRVNEQLHRGQEGNSPRSWTVYFLPGPSFLP